MITGSFPPQVCGVGDFSSRLVRDLRSQGVTVEVFPLGTGGFFCSKCGVHRRREYDLYHIQYPSLGYEWSLCPQFLALRYKCSLVTLHEASQTRLLRRIALVPLLMFSRWIVFTNSFERSFCKSLFPTIDKKSSVIPIGSSILPPDGTIVADWHDREYIVFFGLIRPHRGIEEFLRFAQLLRQNNGSAAIILIGKTAGKWKAYCSRIIHQARSVGIECMLGLDEEGVSALLRKSAFGYLPFPDGLTERRSSALALFAHGVAVISNTTDITPRAIREAVANAGSPEEAANIACHFLDHPQALRIMQEKSLSVANEYSWERIGRSYIDLYTSLIS